MHCCTLNQNMGCLRVHSKYSLACHWLFHWPGMKDKMYWRVLWWRSCELGCFPSQNAYRVKADGMGSTYYRRLPLFELFAIQPWGFIYVRLGHNGLNSCKTICMDVRLLLFSFCVFSEHWSLGSLYTCIRWSWLMSRGPHRCSTQRPFRLS